MRGCANPLAVVAEKQGSCPDRIAAASGGATKHMIIQILKTTHSPIPEGTIEGPGREVTACPRAYGGGGDPETSP
uniref:Uncharacterized protein n=1 Tax=Steinernema glaseri TaxID=37863 RepID=A0A1I8AIX3_9BILA